MGTLMTRLFGISLCSAALIAVTAIGAGHAAAPVRTVNSGTNSFLLPAGAGCAFDVLVSAVGTTTRTVFSDGRTVRVANAEITLTNGADPEQTYLWTTNAHDTETILDDGSIQAVTNGRILYWFFPGDQGPFGVVGENGALFGFVGDVSATFDANTFQITSFSWAGTATELCAELAS